MLDAVTQMVRRSPAPVFTALLWAAVAVLWWQGDLPDLRAVGRALAAAHDGAGELISSVALVVGVLVAYALGLPCVFLQEQARCWFRTFMSEYVRIDGLATWLRRRDPLNRVVDDCVELHSAFPGLFPQLGFRHPNYYELSARERSDLESAIQRDLDSAARFSNNVFDHGRLMGSRTLSAVALPFAVLVSTVAIMADTNWLWGIIIGFALWRILHIIAEKALYDVFYGLLNGARNGTVELPVTAQYGIHVFGPTEVDYDPFRRDVATGAMLIQK